MTNIDKSVKNAQKNIVRYNSTIAQIQKYIQQEKENIEFLKLFKQHYPDGRYNKSQNRFVVKDLDANMFVCEHLESNFGFSSIVIDPYILLNSVKIFYSFNMMHIALADNYSKRVTLTHINKLFKFKKIFNRSLKELINEIIINYPNYKIAYPYNLSNKRKEIVEKELKKYLILV